MEFVILRRSVPILAWSVGQVYCKLKKYGRLKWSLVRFLVLRTLMLPFRQSVSMNKLKICWVWHSNFIWPSLDVGDRARENQCMLGLHFFHAPHSHNRVCVQEKNHLGYLPVSCNLSTLFLWLNNLFSRLLVIQQVTFTQYFQVILFPFYAFQIKMGFFREIGVTEVFLGNSFLHSFIKLVQEKAQMFCLDTDVRYQGGKLHRGGGEEAGHIQGIWQQDFWP